MSHGNGTAVAALAEVHLSAQQRDAQRVAIINQINATTVNVQTLLRAVVDLQAEQRRMNARTFWQRLQWLITGR